MLRGVARPDVLLRPASVTGSGHRRSADQAGRHEGRSRRPDHANSSTGRTRAL